MIYSIPEETLGTARRGRPWLDTLKRGCEAKGGAVERAAIWQDARLRADQGGPALRSPRAAGALRKAPAAYG